MLGLLCSALISWTYKSIMQVLYPLKYEELISNASSKCDVEKELIYAIIKCESGFDENAHSTANAHGLMQITPETFEWLKTCYTQDTKLSESDLKKPEVNIFYGTLLISILNKKYSCEQAVLSAYNAGITTVERWLSDTKTSSNGKDLKYIPYKETRDYVERVKKAKKIYKKLYFNE